MELIKLPDEGKLRQLINESILELVKEGKFEKAVLKRLNSKIKKAYIIDSDEERALYRHVRFDEEGGGDYLTASQVMFYLEKEAGVGVSGFSIIRMGRALSKMSPDKKIKDGIAHYFVSEIAKDAALAEAASGGEGGEKSDKHDQDMADVFEKLRKRNKKKKKEDKESRKQMKKAKEKQLKNETKES